MEKVQLLEQQVQSNAAASNILGEMIEKGEAVQDDQGRVSIIRDQDQ